MSKASVSAFPINRYEGKQFAEVNDLIAVEEPLEIRLYHGKGADRREKSVSVTMRTPGHDFELAAGFLFTENILKSADQIDHIRYCYDGKEEEQDNIVRVELGEDVEPNLGGADRNFYTTSSCGVCGKASIEAIETTAQCDVLPSLNRPIDSELIRELPEKLRGDQLVFEHTGGLHAVGIFDMQGEPIILREDVGRHNAFDKTVGAALMDGKLPLESNIALVSGRASFELVQKNIMAGIPVMAAIGAPSSLAIELAQSFNLTLIGFLKRDKFNIYSGAHRIAQ